MPTKPALKSAPFQPLCRRLLTGNRSGTISTEAKAAQQIAELADRIAPQHRGVLVLERHLHDLRQHVQPGHAVVDLKHRQPARTQHAMALARRPRGRSRRTGSRRGRRRNRRPRRETAGASPSATAEPGRQPLLREILAGQRRRRCRRGRRRTSGRRRAQTGPPQPRRRNRRLIRHVRPRREVHQPKQVVQLLEVVAVEIGEERRRCPADAVVISRSWMCVFQVLADTRAG